MAVLVQRLGNQFEVIGLAINLICMVTGSVMRLAAMDPVFHVHDQIV